VTVTILYFASLREALGIDSEHVSLPPGVGSAGHLRAWLRERGSPWAEALGEGRAVRVAVNRVMAGPETPVADGAEVAFFPPVTGG
jgi:molybdopterin synthase sulfur carrier subunit